MNARIDSELASAWTDYHDACWDMREEDIGDAERSARELWLWNVHEDRLVSIWNGGAEG